MSMMLCFITEKIAELTERPYNDTLNMATRLVEDLGMDVIDIACLELAAEDEYGFQFEDGVEINTVGELYKYIVAHRA